MLNRIFSLLFMAMFVVWGMDYITRNYGIVENPQALQVVHDVAAIDEQSENTYRVARVIDGDTLDVTRDGITKRVRLIGVNTPETVDPRKKVECFGKEASQYLKKLIEGKLVRLENDETQDDVDRYNRLLRYVYLDDGTLVNKKLISEGYAYEYTYRIPYRFQSEFKEAEKNAQESEKGLWENGICSKY